MNQHEKEKLKVVAENFKEKTHYEYTEPPHPIQITEWQKTEGECRDWYEWFEVRGVPVAILSSEQFRTEPQVRYAVFRGFTNKVMVQSLVLKFNLLRACNGFRLTERKVTR